MIKKINSALISVYNKNGLDTIIRNLHSLAVQIYSTGGTEKYITALGIPCISVESVTSYPSILGGRVKTLHPSIFGGILARRDNVTDQEEMDRYHIPPIDLVIVDLYPFEETVRTTKVESLAIEKIDVGGPSMIRAAAKNYADVVVIASMEQYPVLEDILVRQSGETSLDQRRSLAVKAFNICTGYDIAISNYFEKTSFLHPFKSQKTILRYGENPHQQATFYGNISEIFDQLNGKDLSYNNIVDVDAAKQLLSEFSEISSFSTDNLKVIFAIIKHTNVCGVAARESVGSAFESALACDPESAFGGVLITNGNIDTAFATALQDLFFEVLIAPSFDKEAIDILKKKKNRILLKDLNKPIHSSQYHSVLNGSIVQQSDTGNYLEWKEVGAGSISETQKKDLIFANIICKHLKSNAIALVKDRQLIGKGCGQTSRIDALNQAIQKSRHFNFDLENAVLASDAFFPFPDSIEMLKDSGISVVVQPGGSVQDAQVISACDRLEIAMVFTGQRHFKH